MAELTSRHGGISMVKVGGALAIAGTIIGSLIFVAGCFGFTASFALSVIPTLFGAVGLVLAIVGGLVQHPVGVEDTHVLAAILLGVACLLGGLLEIAIWRGVPIFAGAGGMQLAIAVVPARLTRRARQSNSPRTPPR